MYDSGRSGRQRYRGPPELHTWMVPSWPYPTTNLPHGLTASLRERQGQGGRKKERTRASLRAQHPLEAHH